MLAIHTHVHVDILKTHTDTGTYMDINKHMQNRSAHTTRHDICIRACRFACVHVDPQADSGAQITHIHRHTHNAKHTCAYLHMHTHVQTHIHTCVHIHAYRSHPQNTDAYTDMHGISALRTLRKQSLSKQSPRSLRP